MVIRINVEEILHIIQEANNYIDGAEILLDHPIVDEIKNLDEEVVSTMLLENKCDRMRYDILGFIDHLVHIINELTHRITLLCSKDFLDKRLCDYLEYMIGNLQKMEPHIYYLEVNTPLLVTHQNLYRPGVVSYINDFLELKRISKILDDLQELLDDIRNGLEKIIKDFRRLEEEWPLTSSILE